MGERAIRNEPPMLMISDQAHAILECTGWLQYLNRLQGCHEEMTLEFLQNFQNGSTTVRGKSITIYEVAIAKVTGLPAERTKWTEKNVLLHNAIEVF